MVKMFLQGGFVMWPIAFCAFISIAVIAERWLFFGITNISYEYFKKHLLEKMDSDHLHKLFFVKKFNPVKAGVFSYVKNFLRKCKMLRWNSSSYVKISHEYARNIEKGEKSLNEALRRIGSEEIEKMEKNFRVLSAISTISPLLGLLGTVVGIIESFQTIQKMGGQVDVNSLAGGIWVAMITTAAGLIVAIPAQIAYMYFDKKVTERSNRMDYIITYLNEKFFEKKENETHLSTSQKRLA